MELSEQLRTQNVVRWVVWIPRDENEEADAQTNECYGAFSPNLRVPVSWAALRFLVLPRLAAAAVEHFGVLQAAWAAARRTPSPQQATNRRRSTLRVRDTW